MKRLALGCLLLAGCGVEPARTLDSNADPIALEQYHPMGQVPLSTLHCSTEPTDNGNGTSTYAACPFEQQLHNIEANGTVSSEQLLAGGQPVALTASKTCLQWVMGTDSSGATVFVSTSTGAVLSHGLVHAGYPVSVLPAQLSLPLTAQP